MNEIAVFGLGGTIAMTAGARGLVPSHAVASLLPDAMRGDLICEDVTSIPSANLSWALLLKLAGRLRAHFAAGGRGAVVVQGTDTLEETAFIIELLGAGGGPVAFTGAMRGQSAPGADGAANLAAALQLAREGPANLGVVVVMNDQVHAARRARKAHTTGVDAFTSGDAGPMGRFEDGRLTLFHAPLSPLPMFDPSGDPPPVTISTFGFACGTEVLAAAREPSVRGCVLQAFGAGHVPEALVEDIAVLAAAKPVVLCSRTIAGRVAQKSYGYPGGEIDLISRGVVPAARLPASKARVALQLCLASQAANPAETFRTLAALAE